MKGISIIPFAVASIPLLSFANEPTQTENSSENRIGVRGGLVVQQPEYGASGKAINKTTGSVFGVDYTFLSPFDESNHFKWGLYTGVDKVSNTIEYENSDIELDYYSTRAAGVFAYSITSHIDVYGQLGLSYNYGDFGASQIRGIGLFEAVGFSYQSSTGAFSAIEGQIDTFNDGDYEAPISLSVILRAGITF